MASNLDNNRYGQANVVAGWIFAVLGLVVVLLRLWSRRLKRQKLMLNDWFAIIALVLNLILISHTTLAIVVDGLGKHANTVSEYHIRQLKKSLFGLNLEWAFANSFVKLSILHLYTVLFLLRWFRIAAHTVMVLTFLYSLAAFLDIFLTCFPMQYFWDPLGNPGGFCINIAQSWLAIGVANLVVDILIILLPLPVLWRLKVDTTRKLALCAIFSLGIFILAVTGIRIKALMDYNLLDTSYGLGPAVFWSNLEPLLGLINCCLPVIQPAIGMIMGKQLWSKESKHGPNIPYKRNGSSNRKSNKHRPMGRLDPTSYFATSDTESQDALYESQMTHSTHVGLGEVNQENEIVLETSNAILVEQRWEVS